MAILQLGGAATCDMEELFLSANVTVAAGDSITFGTVPGFKAVKDARIVTGSAATMNVSLGGTQILTMSGATSAVATNVYVRASGAARPIVVSAVGAYGGSIVFTGTLVSRTA